MKIYSMTATFGKLEHATLTLKPGLNIIEAPNEWGKSTWCAFLVNMLYGIDTRARTTGTALADKERYAPWSGAPMSGRIDLNWNGRDITIERTTKGRLIFGDFRAYETQSGIDVPELTASNCGQMLLGVERSVFTRAGFLKLADLPVTQDDALRRRLNNLVTTGDESGAGDKLGKQLKELKNKCRYNRNGLLPQAENEQEQLMGQLNELQNLSEQAQRIRVRQEELENTIAQLENHKQTLRYEAAKADMEKVQAATADLEHAKAELTAQKERCQALPDRETVRQNLQSAHRLQDASMALQLQPAPEQPTPPELPDLYRGKTPEQIRTAAHQDLEQLQSMEKRRKQQTAIFTVIAAILMALCIGSVIFTLMDAAYDLFLAGIICGACSLVLFVIGFIRSAQLGKALKKLHEIHAGLTPDQWIADADVQAARLEQYEASLTAFRQAALEQTAQRNALDEKIAALTGGKSLREAQTQWDAVIAQWNALEDAQRDLIRMESHVSDLRSMTKTVEKPVMPDSLTYPESQTDALLDSARFEQKQLQLKLGQNQGRAEALGQEAAIRTKLKAINRRITQLEDTYAALELAQNALSAATTELQRRFAPRISKRAQELFSKLTGGRYQQLTLSQDLSLNTRTESEDVLRSSQWRSDGTVDQLYLALRIAVAEELTADAPLILDDALVRFDDTRLAAALDILQDAAQSKQVIVFTCQSREGAICDA